MVAASVSTPAVNASEKIQWQDVDQLCGQLQLEAPEKKTIIVDGKGESRLYTAYLPDAIVTLYPAKKTEKECCAATPIATARSRKYGSFELKAVQPGYYWLRVQKGELMRVIPVHLTSPFSEESCSDWCVRRSFVVDAIPPKIAIRIR
ncbi:MAG TPA: hypothetical protein VMG31_14350 [Verrucomicrobiae bacterium]|nr:hypothetical protein [Verrucomicrobiae bacterium]